jgi:hypothetical protein
VFGVDVDDLVTVVVVCYGGASVDVVEVVVLKEDCVVKFVVEVVGAGCEVVTLKLEGLL